MSPFDAFEGIQVLSTYTPAQKKDFAQRLIAESCVTNVAILLQIYIEALEQIKSEVQRVKN